MAGTSSISGIISGLKTDDIIAKLIELGKKPIDRLQNNKNALNAKVAAWQDFNTRVKALNDKADALAKADTFATKTITSSDSNLVTGTASTSAQAGSYYIKITNLATTHQLKAEGYADISSNTAGTGTISINVGTGDVKTIDIDSNNNSLNGIKDAINRADAGVTASIINDGTVTNPYRLIITSNTSGQDGAITFNNTLTGGSGLNISELQAAENAEVTIGSGAGALTVEIGSNQVDTVIPGVTLNLQSVDALKVITIKVDNDTTKIKQAVTDFVNQYNNLIDYSNLQFKYNTDNNTSGTLFGDYNLSRVMSDMSSKMMDPVSSLNQSITILSQIGITTNSDGKMSINDTDLDKALKDDLVSVKNLFATKGDSSNASVSYLSSTANTKASGTDGYAVVVTTVATQSRITAGVAQTEALIADETLTINGKSVNLITGMTQADVIDEINKNTNITGVAASATGLDGTGTGNYLNLKRVSYGASGAISVLSSQSNGGGTPTTNTSGIGTLAIDLNNVTGEANTGTGLAGVDIAGTINGETATGLGQVLSGNANNANTAGLRLLITGNTAGNFGSVVFTRGVGGLFSDYTSALTDSTSGTIFDAEKSLKDQISIIDTRMTDLQTMLDLQQARLESQFAAMERAMSQLQAQGQQIASVLSSINNNNNN